MFTSPGRVRVKSTQTRDGEGYSLTHRTLVCPTTDASRLIGLS